MKLPKMMAQVSVLFYSKLFYRSCNDIIMVITKLKYGFQRLIYEILGKEDYWHLKMQRRGLKESYDKYFHDMTKKGFYPGELVSGVPLFYLNGEYPIFFHITTFNYGLGLLDRRHGGADVDAELMNLVEWVLTNQGDDGAWRYNLPAESGHALSNNKASGMTQGLGISFLIRAHRAGFIDRATCKQTVDRALKMMISDEIVSHVNIGKKTVRIIEEFFSPGTAILNGAVFAYYGLYDYGVEFGNLDLFTNYLNDFKFALKKFRFGLWSYYDLNKSINSRFYHDLHINMMKNLAEMSGDLYYLKYQRVWTLGSKFSLFYLCLKSVQKLLSISDMLMNRTNLNDSQHGRER